MPTNGDRPPAGELAKGSTLTQAEIAKQLGVSRWLVNRALRGDEAVHPQTRERILSLCREHGYRPSSAARTMQSGRTNAVGVLVRNNKEDPLAHLVGYETILGVNEGLEAEGYVLSIIRADDVVNSLNSSSRVFEEHMLDGLVVLAEVEERVANQVERLIGRCVWVETPRWADVGCVRRDEAFAGRECAERLIRLGYQEVVYVAPPPLPGNKPQDYSRSQRETAAMEVLRNAGVEIRRVEHDWNAASSWAETPELVRSFTRRTGVIMSQELQARWLQHAASSIGLNPGHDFGVVCCDDSTELSRMWPGLCRVSFDRYELGLKAASMMLSMLTEDRLPESYQQHGYWKPGNTAWGPGTA